jgi:hypothetical protein
VVQVEHWEVEGRGTVGEGLGEGGSVVSDCSRK